MQLCESKDVKGYKPCPLTTLGPLLILTELTSSTPKAKVIDTKYYKQLGRDLEKIPLGRGAPACIIHCNIGKNKSL